MKFSVECNPLATQCRKARKYVQKGRYALPILGNILLVANKSDQTLQVISTNLEDFYASKHIPARVETSGAITIPPRTFIDVLATLKKESIDIDVDHSVEQLNYKFDIAGLRGYGYINCISAEDYPCLKDREWITS